MPKNIRSSEAVIEQFIASLEDDPCIDKGTLEVLRELQVEGKLSKTRLLQLLARTRQDNSDGKA